MFWTKLGYGVAAGAAGVTGLNAITYLDMAFRARPSSDTPARAVEQLAAKAGAGIPGSGGDRDNRLAGLGPLAGIVTGVAVGVAAAFAYPAGADPSATCGDGARRAGHGRIRRAAHGAGADRSR